MNEDTTRNRCRDFQICTNLHQKPSGELCVQINEVVRQVSRKRVVVSD